MNDTDVSYVSWESLKDEFFPNWRRWDRRLLSRLRFQRYLAHNWLHSVLFPLCHEANMEERYRYCYCDPCMAEREAEYAANPPIWQEDAA